mgnify:CR=1 FL=1
MKLRRQILSAVLAASMVFSPAFSAVPGTVHAAESNAPTLTVDMTPSEERGLKHGASGWLYGQGDESVPTANTMTALKPHTAVQKAPYGMQHPNGDTLDIAETFLNAGGHDIQIYVPDYYALWFYEFSSTEEYLEILKMQAQACIDKGIEDKVVYVLYNEPFDNWIGGSYTDPETGTVSRGWDSLNWFWEDMYQAVVKVYEDNKVDCAPRFAGLNLAGYNESVMDAYVKFCVEHDCMPDVVTWHDLSTWQFDNFGKEYDHYRSLEKKYGVDTPREIVINEYAADYECSSPGDLVRWIGLFEEYNVSGCMPFWHLSNNLNGIAADNNEGNGAWWLYKWYGDMSGQYLPVQTSNAQKNDFYGAASLDNNKKSANVIFGGMNGAGNIVLDDIDKTETFKNVDKVHVKLEATDYTGFHGVAEEPRVVKEGAVEVADGKAVIPVSDMLEMSGYRITVTQATDDETIGFLSTTWKGKYEAENGSLSGRAALSDGAGNMACSGRKKVGWIWGPEDGVDMQVTVPKDGYYKYDMVYTAGNGCNTAKPSENTPYTAYQTLLIDGEKIERMILPTTLNFGMGGMYSTYVYLSAGTHTLRIAGVDQTRSADVDCIYLTYKGPEETDTEFHKVYEAELSEFNELIGNKTALTTERDGNVDYVTGLEKTSVTKGGGLRVNVIVPENGMYTLKLRYASKNKAEANIYQDNDAVNLEHLTAAVKLKDTKDKWESAYQTVFLQKGINVVDIDTTEEIRLDYVEVFQMTVEPTAVVEAESGVLTGEAAVGNNADVETFASGVSYVAGIKAANDVEVIEPDDPDFEIYGRGRFVDLGEAVDKNSLTITVDVPEAGEYNMAVYQSNGELFGEHVYNAQMTERYASFSINGGEAKKTVFRNTYSDETFRSQVIPVTLKKGKNTIKIYNDNSKVVTNGIHKGGDKIPANIDYNVLVNYTPNFDKFEFYPMTAKTQATEETFRVTTASSEGGQVVADKVRVNAGDTVRLEFNPDANAVLKDATVNGESIMDSLNKNGGVYVIANVQDNVEVTGVFEKTEEEKNTLLYSVNCGDIDPKTLSQGDAFGRNNSVTDQFYGTDAKTGKKWGVVDTYQADANYPDWLTGAKTWPCENDGATDASPRSKSFRYAKNQAVTDVGIVYKFELEANKTYNLELGFYVPAGWTNVDNPRTMKLVVNGKTVAGYESFTASNDSNAPYVIKTTAAADADGNLEVQIGHAANAVWGPVISYMDITDVSETPGEINADKEKKALEELVKEYENIEQGNYTDESWSDFVNAMENAKYALESKRFTPDDVNEAAKRLTDAKAALKEKAPISVQLPYVDVEKGAWYYNAVEYNYIAKTMTGKDDKHFAPAETLVRAQFAAVLHKMNAQPEMQYTEKFPDVQAGDWFMNPVLWASENKIVTGYTGTGMFGPNDNVTRAQMAVMMYRYAKDFKGYDVKADGDYSTFPDAGDVQEFAVDALKWAVSEGIITGKTIDGELRLDPQGSANRAECATIIQRFMEKYEK